MSSAKRPTPESLENTNAFATLSGQQELLFANGAIARQMLDSLPNPLLIINRNWQVVYANHAVLGMFEPTGSERPVGLREGEPFHCLHSRSKGSDPEGSLSCRICGVARAVALALQGRETVSDCRLSCELAGSGSPIDLRVRATPLVSGGDQFSILNLNDIRQEKRRAMLAGACFHDLLNTLTSIRGLLDVLKHSDVSERPEICELLEQTTLGSIEEIMTLRLLEQAEESTLMVNWSTLKTGEFLDQQLKTLQRHPEGRDKLLSLEAGAADVDIHTDRNLLRRVIGNMVLNALEATDAGRKVTVGCRVDGEEVEFRVHNERPIPIEVQPRIFSRSFSTKGQSRGFGTYSVQLLSALLGGSVGFDSSPEAGTTFFARFSLQPRS